MSDDEIWWSRFVHVADCGYKIDIGILQGSDHPYHPLAVVRAYIVRCLSDGSEGPV